MKSPRNHPPSSEVPETIPRQGHNISRKDIDPDALKVLYRLHRHGHIAYLVGGGVRDLLLKRKPKDFDISTSAHPNEIKKLFVNCRLIGRRFRLAHIYFKGGKIIEVSTFRTISEFGHEDGPIKSDNTFGTPEMDAFRRDFTLNALFYNIANFSVIDYVNGLEDLKSGIVRCIGDPVVRFKEDPIRMLRGVRFAALLDFSLDQQSSSIISTLRNDIWEGATPRIFEEILRMLGRGSSGRTLSLMHQLGLIETLFPKVFNNIRRYGIDEYLDIFSRVDNSFKGGQELKPALVLAALFYPVFRTEVARSTDSDFLNQARSVLTPMSERLQIPRRMQDTMRQAMAAQHRFFALKDTRYKPRTILRKSYFDDALTLFELVAGGTPEGRQLIRNWNDLKKNGPGNSPTRRNRRKRKRGRQPKASPAI
jgi:poly(A) polymerase